MKRHQLGHCEVEYGDLKPEVTMWFGIVVCGLGFVFIVASIGWVGALGIAIAIWGYKLQIDGSAELMRQRSNDGVLPSPKPQPFAYAAKNAQGAMTLWWPGDVARIPMPNCKLIPLYTDGVDLPGEVKNG